MCRRARKGTGLRENVCVSGYVRVTYRGGAAVPDERDYCVVAARAASCRVDNDPDGLVLDEG